MRRLIDVFDVKTKPKTQSHEDTAAARAKRKQKAGRKLIAFRTAAVSVPAILLGTGIGIGVWAWQTGRMDAQKFYLTQNFYSATSAIGLTVKNVQVNGRNYTSVEEVVSAIGLADGGPILGLDPQDTQKRFEALPWVKTAAIRRQLPDTVQIDLKEREPLALWQKDYRHTLVDHSGDIIPDAPVRAYGHLPIVVGEGAASSAPQLLASLRQHPELYKKVKSAIRVSNRRWTVVLNNEILVVLPEEAVEEAWHRLSKLQNNEKILDRAIKSVDLRLPDRVVLRLIGASSDSEKNEKNT